MQNQERIYADMTAEFANCFMSGCSYSAHLCNFIMILGKIKEKVVLMSHFKVTADWHT
jgi:hypothetical protein